MKKIIIYLIFFIATALVVILFVTSKDYLQLGLAAVLYPLIAFMTLQLFPRHAAQETNISFVVPTKVSVPKTSAFNGVSDENKRAFLKLIGAAGVSVFLFSIFSKRGQIPFFGKMTGSDSVVLKDIKGKTVDPSQAQPLDGFQICEIEDSLIAYYGFINKDGAWYIMREDTQNSSFRYAKGGSSFPNSWSSRSRLKYDYFYNV